MAALCHAASRCLTIDASRVDAGPFTMHRFLTGAALGSVSCMQNITHSWGRSMNPKAIRNLLKFLTAALDGCFAVARTGVLAGVACGLLVVSGCGGGGAATSPGGTQGASEKNLAAPATPTSGQQTVIAGCRAAADSGRVAYWSFDNVSAATAFNTKFAAFHASLNSVSVVPGVVGQALQFDSALNQSYAEINVWSGGATTKAIFPDAHISVAMWINPTQPGSRRVPPTTFWEVATSVVKAFMSVSLTASSRLYSMRSTRVVRARI